jgi:flagellar biosynthesis GTPase FlhF
MLIKSFFGESMSEAMQKAAKQLGDDALILNSRETPADLRSHGRFEVVATVTHEQSPAALAALLAEPAAPETTPPALQREIHLFAGLNGSGKTTCALKMAVKRGVWLGKSTAILHFDTSRIARQESLLWYCQAAGIRCLSPMDLSRLEAKDELARIEVLLIDTSAMANEGALPDYLTPFLSDANYSGHLVAPSWASSSYFTAAQPLIHRFRLQYFLPTFLDDSMLSEDSANAAAKLDLGVRFLSSGGKAPNGLWQSDEAHLAELAAARSNPPAAKLGAEIGPKIASTPGRSSYSRAAASEMVA